VSRKGGGRKEGKGFEEKYKIRKFLVTSSLAAPLPADRAVTCCGSAVI